MDKNNKELFAKIGKEYHYSYCEREKKEKGFIKKGKNVKNKTL